MNNFNMIGNLTAKPEIEYRGDNNTAVTKFNIAISRGKDKGADFPRLTAFGSTAENIAKYFDKGSKIGVSGHISTGSFQNKEGATVYTQDNVVDRFDFCDKSNKQTPAPASKGDEDFMNIPDDMEGELPFN